MGQTPKVILLLSARITTYYAPGMQAAAALKFDDIALPKETKLDKEIGVFLK